MTFRDLKVGDRVTRMMGDNKKFMDMVVVRVGDRYLWCAPNPTGEPVSAEQIAKYEAASQEQVDALWKFDRDIGVEEDDDLKWGRSWGVTGTYLEHVKEDA